MLALISGLALFLLIHLVPQRPALKNKIVERVGMTGYRALHGLVALVAIVLILFGYFESRYDFDLWYPPVWTRHLAATLMVFACIFLLAAPFKGKIKEKLTSPLSVALKVWALAHLLANGTLSDVILFGFFLLYAVSYRISLKRRIAAGLVSVPQGRWVHDVYAVVLGLGFYIVVVLWLHEWAFDVAPFI